MPSTAIARYSYSTAEKALYITYISGATYVYRGVPESVFHSMKRAVSKGRFVNKKIKGFFPYEKVS